MPNCLCSFREATNMTDRMAALTALCEHDTPARAAALEVRRTLLLRAVGSGISRCSQSCVHCC
jgi:Domain of unknown function (DUF3458_C) ARM repeats